MIRRTPSEYYLKYLLSHTSRRTNEQVIQIARQLGLDYLGSWYLDALRSSMKVPRPFYPQDLGHAKSMKFLTKHMLRQVYQPDDFMGGAYNILERPRVRELVEVLMLSGAPDQAIVYALEARHSFITTPQSLARYRHYFWNVELLDTTELRALLRMRTTEVIKNGDSEISAQLEHLEKVKWRDARTVAADLPQGSIAALIAQAEVGIMPPADRMAAALEQAAVLGALRAVQEVSVPSKGSSMRYHNYSAGAKICADLLENVVKPEDQLREDLQQIQMRTTEETVPSIQSLTGGDHTTELLPGPTGQEETVSDEDSRSDGRAEAGAGEGES